MKKEDEYIPLGCTFRELLLSCDPVEVSAKAALKDLETHVESLDPKKKESIDFFLNQMAGYDTAICEIIGTDYAVDHRPMGWAVYHVDADEFTDFDWIGVNLYNWDYVKPPKDLCPSKWEDKHWRTFSASFAPWTEHADREIMITQKALNMCRSLSDIAAEIMWEATFSGFSGKAAAARGDEILGACKLAMDAYFAESEKTDKNKQ